MSKKENKKNVRKLSGCIIILFGLSFVITSIGVILTIVFGDDLNEFFTNEYEESDLGWYKITFWVLIISIITFFLSGGKLSDIKQIMKGDDGN